jgi:hypothetical protein
MNSVEVVVENKDPDVLEDEESVIESTMTSESEPTSCALCCIPIVCGFIYIWGGIQLMVGFEQDDSCDSSSVIPVNMVVAKNVVGSVIVFAGFEFVFIGCLFMKCAGCVCSQLRGAIMCVLVMCRVFFGTFSLAVVIMVMIKFTNDSDWCQLNRKYIQVVMVFGWVTNLDVLMLYWTMICGLCSDQLNQH